MKIYSRAVLAAVLGLLIWVVFSPVIGHDFINMDDDLYVYGNRYVRQGLTRTSIRWAFTSLDLSYWHPLTVLSHQLDVQLYGLNPAGHHLTGLLIHLVISLLLFLVLDRFMGQPWSSAFVAALFGLHPLRVEVVAWVSERKELLSTFFWVTTMAVYLHYLRRPAWTRYTLVVASFCLGLMAKPMLVTLPVILLLLDYWPLGRLAIFGRAPSGTPSIRRVILEKIPLLLLTSAASLLSILAQESMYSLGDPDSLPLAGRVATMPVAYVRYLWKMILPRNLAIFYPHHGPVVPWGSVAASLVFLALVTILIWRWRQPWGLVGWLWYLVTLLPVSGLIQVGSHFTADRYTYLPLIGVFLLMASGADSLSRAWKHRRGILAVAGGSVIVVLMVLSRIQVGYWRNSRTLFAHTLQVTRNNWQAYNNYAIALAADGQLAEAVNLLRRALPITPSGIEMTHMNLGVLLADQGKIDEAIRQFQEAVRIFPPNWKAHYDLGVALAQAGRHEDAAAAFGEAVRIHPLYPEALFNLGNSLSRLEKLAEAESAYRKALGQDPAFAEAHFNLAVLLDREGRRQEAEAHMAEARRLDPRIGEGKPIAPPSL